MALQLQVGAEVESAGVAHGDGAHHKVGDGRDGVAGRQRQQGEDQIVSLQATGLLQVQALFLAHTPVKSGNKQGLDRFGQGLRQLLQYEVVILRHERIPLKT